MKDQLLLWAMGTCFLLPDIVGQGQHSLLTWSQGTGDSYGRVLVLGFAILGLFYIEGVELAGSSVSST